MTTEPEWTDERDAAWADRFTWHASLATPARHDDITAWLDVVHDAVTDTGRTAEDLFGPPDDAAQELAAQLPAERRAATDLDAETPRSVARLVLLNTGWFTAALGLGLLLSDGWMLGVTSMHLVVLATLALGGTGSTMAVLAWSSGRPGVTLACTGATILTIVGLVGLGMGVLDRTSVIATVPTPALVTTGAVLMLLWWRWPEPTTTLDTESRGWPADQWFTRLEWLLRGRHHLPADVARTAVAECRAHATDAGTHPYDLFGPPQVHALALADADPATSDRAERFARRGHLAMAVAALTLAAIELGSGEVGWQTCALLVLAGGFAVSALPRRRRTTG